MSRSNDGSTSVDDRLTGRSSWWIWLYGLTLLLIDLGPGWVLTYHENVFAGGAREFLREGNWLIPRYLGLPLFEYPPLTQWLIAASMAAFRSDSEWVARLPIALATVLNAWLIGKLAARWHGDRVGLVAGLIQLTTFYGLMQARLAEADMIVAATVTAAMACFAVGVVDRPEGTRTSRWLAVGYFAATSLSFLAKGPIGPAFIALGSLAYALIDRRRAIWRCLFDPIGWGLLLAIAGGWILAMFLGDSRTFAMMRENILDRFTTGKAMHTDGRENAVFYLYTVPYLLLPWTPWVFGGLARGSASERRPVAFWKFLGCWFGAGLVLLSCSAFKHKHYAIPLLPPLSILAACGLVRHAWGRRPIRQAPAIMMAVTLMGAISVAILARTSPGQEWLLSWLAAMVATAGLGATLSFWLRIRGRPERSLMAVFGAVWLVVLIVRSAVLPAFDDYRDDAALARRVNAKVAPEAPIYLVHAKRAQMTYYLRPPLLRRDELADFTDLVARKGDGETTYAIAPEADIGELAKLGDVKILEKSRLYKHLTVVEIRRNGSGIASMDKSSR